MILPILYTVAIIESTCLFMVIAITATFINSLGGTQLYLGILSSTCALITLVWNPVVGSLSDVLGSKKVLVRCLLVSILGNLIITVSPSLTTFFISRVVCVFGSQTMTLVKSLVDDNVESKEAKMGAIGTMHALFPVGFIVGALVSGYLSEYENGVRYVFGLMSALLILSLVLISLVADKQTSKKSDSVAISQQITSAARNLTKINWPKYWDLFVVKLAIDFSLCVFQFNAGHILTQRFGVGGKTFGNVLAFNSIVAITSALVMKRVKGFLYLKDDSGLDRLFHCNLLLIFAFWGLGTSSNLTFYLLFNMPIMVVRILTETTVTEVLLARASPTEKGSILGAFESTVSLGGLTAPLISAVITETWSDTISMLSCTVPLILGATLTRSQKSKIA